MQNNHVASDTAAADDGDSSPPSGRVAVSPPAGSQKPISAILNRIRQLTRPAAPPAAWAFLKTSPSIRQLKAEAVELAAALKAEFAIEQLRDARVLVPGTHDELVLSPVFGGSASKFVILVGPDGAPTDAISSRGVLSEPDPPILRYSLTRQRQSPWEARQRIIVAATDDDMHVLHELGKEFTSAAGIETLSWPHVRELLAVRKSQISDAKYVLTIPAWQIARVRKDAAQPTLKALEQLERIARESDYEPSALINVWIPTSQEFSAIKKARQSSRADLMARFSYSLKVSSCSVSEALRYFRDRALVDYGTARRRLTRAVELSIETGVPHVAEAKAALNQMDRAFRAAVSDKFYSPNAADGDGFEQLRRLMAAEIAEYWYKGQDLIVAAHSLMAGEFPRQFGVIDYETLGHRLRLTDSFARLYSLDHSTNGRHLPNRRARINNSAAQKGHAEKEQC